MVWNRIPSFFIFRGMAWNGILSVFCSTKQRNSDEMNQYFRRFRVPRIIFSSEKNRNPNKYALLLYNYLPYCKPDLFLCGCVFFTVPLNLSMLY